MNGYVPVNIVQTVAGVLVTFAACYELYEKRHWFRCILQRKEDTVKGGGRCAIEEGGSGHGVKTNIDSEMGQVKGLNPEEGFGANSVAGQQKCSEMVQDKFHSDSSLAAANINIDVDGPEQIKTPSISTSSPPQHNTQSSDSEFDKKPDTNSHSCPEKGEDEHHPDSTTVAKIIFASVDGLLGQTETQSSGATVTSQHISQPSEDF